MRAHGLHVRTTFAESADLLSLLPSPKATTWVHNGDGLVGWGVAATATVRGQERFARAQRWWARLCEQSAVEDEVMIPGSGPIAFASFGFSEDSDSVLTVPATIVGQRDGKAWITRISPGEYPSASPPVTPRVTRRADPDADRWHALIAESLDEIATGMLDKVVLARRVTLSGSAAIDPRIVLRRLADRYPECWTFSVDGLIGATPELLVRRSGEQVMSRVLAGTVRRAADDAESDHLADEMVASTKAREEHRYAVSSVAHALATHCTDLHVPDSPSVLPLANVQHLATDIHGMLVGDTSAVALAAALHPTAAVCGTPTERAFDYILAKEGFDRGRYAGPVGWFDRHGDGEFGIALRCGLVHGAEIDLFAGCGIVSGSDPGQEYAESEAKFSAMLDALGT